MADKKIFEISDGGAGNLEGKYRHSWVEEAFDLENNSKHPRLAVNHTHSYLGTGIQSKKIKILMLCLAVGFFLIIVKTFCLQIFSGANYRQLAEGNRIRLRPIAAERGIIYDRFNRPLVENVPSFSLVIVPRDLPTNTDERTAVVQRAAQIAQVPPDYIDGLLKKYGAFSYESLVIKENLDYEHALRSYVEDSDLPGVLIESGTKRLYLNKDADDKIYTSWSHLLGYLGKLDDDELQEMQNQGYLQSDNIGKIGIEKFYEHELRGKYGKKKIEVNALGREQNILAEEPPAPGKNLTLTVDRAAQEKMEDLVRRFADATGKKRLAAVALNPNNGEILALVSWPAFDNNDFSGGISTEKYSAYINNGDRPLFNRAIAGTYPSGSTVKLVVAAAALQEGIINRSTSFLSIGGLQVGNWFFKDWKAGGHGITNVVKALAWSVNTFFYYIGGGYDDFEGLGVEKLTQYMRKFNLASPTGIDLTGERSGFLPSKDWKQENKNERWYIGDTYNLAIGQGDLLVTPLQVSVYTAAVANGGEVVTPHLVAKATDPVDKDETVFQPLNKEKNFISPTNIDIVRQGMRACVTEGSCQLLTSLPFSAAGKTGTAQWSDTKNTHAWFTSFAPYNNPQIVVTILIEEGGEGSTAAMPIARDFLDWWGKKYLTPKGNVLY